MVFHPGKDMGKRNIKDKSDEIKVRRKIFEIGIIEILALN